MEVAKGTEYNFECKFCKEICYVSTGKYKEIRIQFCTKCATLHTLDVTPNGIRVCNYVVDYCCYSIFFNIDKGINETIVYLGNLYSSEPLFTIDSIVPYEKLKERLDKLKAFL